MGCVLPKGGREKRSQSPQAVKVLRAASDVNQGLEGAINGPRKDSPKRL